MKIKNYVPTILLAISIIAFIAALHAVNKDKTHPSKATLQTEYDACKKFWGDVMPSMVTDPCHAPLSNPTRYGRPPAPKPPVDQPVSSAEPDFKLHRAMSREPINNDVRWY